MLAVVFTIGLAHKLRSPGAFVTILNGYRLLPPSLAAPTAYFVLAAELVAALSLLLNLRLGSIVALMLLFVYTVAVPSFRARH